MGEGVRYTDVNYEHCRVVVIILVVLLFSSGLSIFLLERVSAPPVFEDDMDPSEEPGWAHMSVGGGGIDLWNVTTLDSYSPPNSWWCGNESTSMYEDADEDGTPNEMVDDWINCALFTPVLDLSPCENVTLDFMEKYETENGWDECWVEMSDDNGMSWDTVLLNGTERTGNSGGWQNTNFTINGPFTSEMQIRFRFDTQDGRNNDYSGWFIDDVLIHWPVPDFNITSENISYLPFPARAGSEVHLNALFSNNGEAAENIEVRFYLNDPDADQDNIIDTDALEIGTTVVTNISEGGQAQVNTTWCPQDAGSHNIYVWIDPADSISEFSEVNNMAMITVLSYNWVDSFDNTTYTESRQNIHYKESDAFIRVTWLRGKNWTKQGMVMDLGASGEPDEAYISDHTVLKGDDGIYKMWYTGNNGTNGRIMYANSTNGTNWTKHGVVVDLGGALDPDNFHALNPAVIKDYDAPASERYKMWYGGYNGTDWHVMYANSSNGLNWTKRGVVMNEGLPGEPDDEQVVPSFVMKENGEYRMWYTGFDDNYKRIFYANSTNGTNWTKQGLVLDVGPSGAPDDGEVTTPCLVKDQNGVYHMWYTGHDGTSYRICYATSLNGIDWLRQGLALDFGAPGEWDNAGLSHPHVILDSDGYYKMWYIGNDGTATRVMYAILSEDDREDFKFDFNTSNEGFYLKSNQPNAQIYWDSSNGNIFFRAHNSDPLDEMFVRTLPFELNENTTSWTLSARFTITTDGVWQYAMPLFIGDSSNADVRGEANQIHFAYDSDTNTGRGYYEDSTSTVRASFSTVISVGIEYHVKVIYDNETKNLTLQLLDADNVLIIEDTYTIGTNPNDGFTFGEIGVSVNGYSGSPNPVCLGWTDDINFKTYLFNKANVLSKPITLPQNERWGALYVNKTELQDTYINVTVLDTASGLPISGFENLTEEYIDISTIDPTIHPSIRLLATFTGNETWSPRLHYWAVNWRVWELTIPLSEGWNMISLPMNLSTRDLITILSDVDYRMVRTYNASELSDQWKQFHIDRIDTMGNDLADIDKTDGIWILMENEDNLTLRGKRPDPTNISLKEGWNFVGYPSLTNRTVGDGPGWAFEGMSSEIVVVQYYNASNLSDHWKEWDPGTYTPDDLLEVEPGFGLWIKVKSDCTWTVDW